MMTAASFAKKWALVGGVVLLGFAGYYLYNNRTVVTVGDYKIPAKYIKYQDRVTKVFYPDTKDTKAQDQLVRAYTYAQILKNNNQEVTPQKLESELKRIETNTKDPATLKKVKDIFGGDKEAMLNVFILKTYVDRTLYSDFFSTSPRAQQDSLRRVSDVLSQARQGSRSFKQIADDTKLRLREFSVSEKDGIVWHDSVKKQSLKKDRDADKGGKLIDKGPKAPVAPEHVQKRVQERMDGDMQSSVRIWVENIAPGLKAGEVLGEPVDHSYSWLVVKMKEVRKSAAGNSYRLEALEIPKDNFEAWLKKEKDNVKIH